MKKYILVAGSINMDLVFNTSRLPLKGESIHGKSIKYIPGGKGANQAVAAKRLGAEVEFIGKLGNDNFGLQLKNYLLKEKISLKGISQSPTNSGLAVITVGDTGENTIVILPGSNADVTENYIESFTKLIKNANIIVSQYEIPKISIYKLFQIAKQYDVRTVLSPSPASATKDRLFRMVDYLILNETELSFFVGSKKTLVNQNSIIQACKKLLARGVKNVVVTLGEYGSMAVNAKQIIKTKGIKVKTIDTTAAGDCFTGALATQLNNNVELSKALGFANKAAAISVTRWGASSSLPYLKEIK